jgi:hypothetical protein
VANPKIQVDITADASKLKKGVGEAEKAIGGLDDATSKLGKTSGDVARNNLGPLGDIADTLGFDLDGVGTGALAAGAGMAALAGFAAQGVGKLTDLADSVRKVHDASGLSFESSSRLVAISDDLGISAETVASSMGRLAKNIDAGKLQEYGIAAEYAADGTIDMEATLGNVADKMNATVDPTRKAAMGTALFGKSWADLAPVLQQGSGGIRDMMAAVSDGQIVTEENAQAAREWSMALDDAQDAISELQMSMAKDMLPTLALMAQDFAAAAQGVNSLKEKSGGLLDVQTLMNPLAQIYNARLEDQARKAEEAAKSMDGNAESVAAAGLAAVQTTTSTEDLAEATEASTRAAEDHVKALDRQATALLGLFNKELAADSARKDFDDTLADLSTATDDYSGTLDEAKGKALSAASAQVELAKQSAAASGSSLDAAQAQTVFRDALVDLSAQVEDPTLRAYLDETVARLNASETAGYGAAGGFNAAAAAARSVGAAAAEAAAALIGGPSTTAGGGFQPLRAAGDTAAAGVSGLQVVMDGYRVGELVTQRQVQQDRATR